MTTKETKDLNKYEILYFVNIILESEEIKNIKQKVADIITKADGIIIKEDDIGKRKLAYMIKGARHGHYIYTVFKTTKGKVESINHELELMPEIIRHKLTIKEDIKTIQPRERLKKADKKSTPKPTEQKEETKKETKVDVEELDRKIDELLSENNI